MKKMIIPRRDHEVYFILLPDEIKTKQIESYVSEQLDRLHPVYHPALALSLKKITFNKMPGKEGPGKARWVMATVMDAATLAEYRILHKDTTFYTNTSITVSKKDFFLGAATTIGDELIGFDLEKNTPFSIPLEHTEPEGPDEQMLRLKKIPSSHGVFGQEKPQWFIPALAAAILLIMAASAVFFFRPARLGETPPVLVQKETFAEETRYLPMAIEILARFAASVVEIGGQITHWHYDERNEPFLIVNIRGMDVLSIQQICSLYEYFSLQDIQDVRYVNGESFITIHLNTQSSSYTAIPAIRFPAQSLSLPIISALAKDLKNEGILIASEMLPGTANEFYTVTFFANDQSLIRSLEIISEYCQKYSLKVAGLDLSINSENNLFTVVCVIAQIDSQKYVVTPFEAEKNLIPVAFGYRESLSAPVIVIPPEPENEAPILGSIRDASGQIIFYRDTNDGRIKIREQRTTER